ncbi:DUF4232 domain-containing protein [Streptomyces sp. NPDC047434]
MITARERGRTYALGALVIAALLAGTACEAGGTDDGASGGPSGPPSATGSTEPGGTTGSGTPEPSGSPASPSGSPEAGGSGTPGGTGQAAAPACADPDLSITTSFWQRDSGQHLLITATNAGGRTCTLYHYPYVGFGENADTPIGPMESKPRAIATIKPKQKAYAGVRLFRAGERTVTVESFALGYQDRALGSNRDVASLDIAVSGEVDFLNVGPNPLVTYWNTDRGAIEDFLFRSGRG